MESLDYDENLKVDLIEAIKEAFAECDRLRSVEECANLIENAQFIKRAQITEVNAGKGTALIELAMPDELFYKILSDRSGLDINDDRALINMIKDLGRIKRAYERLEYALREVELKGYGIVMPTVDEMRLEDPEIVRQGNRFGVRLRASAPSIHMIKADIETEIAPFVGTENNPKSL